MKKLYAVAFSLLFAAPIIARADDVQAQVYPNTLTLADGTRAVPEEDCGVGDACATVTFANGDVETFYSLGARKHEPYKVHIVRITKDGLKLVDDTTALEESQHDVALNTAVRYMTYGIVGTKHDESSGEFTLDHGKLHVGLYQNQKGDLFARVWQTAEDAGQ